MSITDELRDYARHLHNVWYDPRGNVYTYTTMDNAPSLDAVRLDEHVLAIADRIDAEHTDAQRRWMAELDAARDRDGYIELPKDADGEPILIGDVMKGEKIGGGFCEPFEVVGYIMSNGEFEPMDEHKCPRKHKYLHHHKQQTVEDVLCEMLDVVDDDRYGQERIIAEYAAKLRLADDRKEQ